MVYLLECGLQARVSGLQTRVSVYLDCRLVYQCIWIAGSCISVSGLQARVSIGVWIAGSCITWSMDCRLVYHLECGLQDQADDGNGPSKTLVKGVSFTHSRPPVTCAH
jgi:hypothetical protein